MTHRLAFIDHRVVAPFLPYLRSYVLKGLQELKTNGEQFKATAEELYAANVFERVGELDNTVKSLHLAIGFILDMTSTHEDAPEVYRYHHENFLLRLTGLVDRAHRLVGTSMQLNSSVLGKNGANQFVRKSIQQSHPELLECLKNLDAVADQHKTSRNEIAHSKAFSTRKLGLFSAASSLSLDLDDEIQINELMKSYFSESGAELAVLAAEMVTGIEALLDALAPIHEHLFSGNT